MSKMVLIGSKSQIVIWKQIYGDSVDYIEGEYLPIETSLKEAK